MATLPIRQVEPFAEESAKAIPGIPSAVLPAPPPKNLPRKPALRTPVFLRAQDESGIHYGMEQEGEANNVPTVPVAVRSSLAQTISTFKVQLSHYISSVRPGPVPKNYPVAKVLTLVNTAPRMKVNPTPTGRSGYMNAPRRFTKALPAPVNNYQPAIYGQREVAS